MTRPVSIPHHTPTLPAWVEGSVDFARKYTETGAQIRLAITLADLNVRHTTGGPFGAAVFASNGRLVAVGVNRVEPLQSSLAHAEIVALVGAQRCVGRARLNAGGDRYTLATSAQPCCQCYGAIVWAGLSTLLIAARSADTETLAGFDEGPLPADWIGELTRRGVQVVRDLERDAACAVLARYRAGGGARY